jgi:AraC-like DNA-binding protein
MKGRVGMWTDPRFKGFGVEQVALAPGGRRDRLHDHYAILITASGGGILTSRDVQHQATPDSGCVFGPDRLWTARAVSHDPWRYETIYLSRRLLWALTAHLDLPGESLNAFTGVRVLSAEALEAARRVLAVFRTHGLVVARVAALIEFIETLFQGSCEGHTITDGARAARHVCTFLHEHFREGIQTAQLARLVSLTPFHFIRVFRAAVGVPPHRYVTLVRLRCAEQLLRAGVRLVDVADRAGFCDQSHLNRWFRRILGVTPAQYQKAYCFRVRPTITAERVLAYELRTGEKLWRYWARLHLSRANCSH